jgi:hypothetical protein
MRPCASEALTLHPVICRVPPDTDRSCFFDYYQQSSGLAGSRVWCPRRRRQTWRVIANTTIRRLATEPDFTLTGILSRSGDVSQWTAFAQMPLPNPQ